MGNRLPDIPHDAAPTSALSSADQCDAAAHWQALLDAGLIGNRQPVTPENRATIRHMEALFRSAALYRREQARAFGR